MRLYLLVVLALVSALLASAVHAQSTQPMGNGDAHGMMGGRMMAGHMMGGHMMGGHMMGGAMGVHGMMARRAAAAAAPESSAASATQAEESAQDVTQTGAPASFLAALQSADPQRGRQLAASAGCLGCHSLSSRQRLVGPTWYNLAETAETRVPGQSAEAYLYTSIVHPNAYVVAGYQPNIMVQTYGLTLAEAEIADLAGYLLTLREQE